MVEKLNHVYFVQAGANNGHVKIGFARDVKKRMDGLQTGNPLKLSLLYSLECGDSARLLEASFHRLFDNLRFGTSEWFRWSKDIGQCIALLRNVEKNFAATGGNVRFVFELYRDPKGGVGIRPVRRAPVPKPFTPTLMVCVDASKLGDLPANVQRAWFESGKVLVRLVDREEGFIVSKIDGGVEFWRARWDGEMTAKHCVECGVELNEEVHHETRFGGGDQKPQLLIHFCEEHPSK